jgi:hypothetical protein
MSRQSAKRFGDKDMLQHIDLALDIENLQKLLPFREFLILNNTVPIQN